MNVSVIFVNYNTSQLTQDAIQSVYQKTKGITVEVIVVDNASVDNSVEAIKTAFPEVTLIANKKNVGFGRANNIGMQVAKGDYFFLLNTDAYLINNAIEILFNFMEEKENASVGIAGGHMFRENGNNCISSANFPNYKLFVKGSFWKHFYKKTFYINEVPKAVQPRESNPYQVDYVSGADFFIRRSVIDEIGGFNKRFFLYYEETELCLRLTRKIKDSKIMIVPNAHVVHIGQGSDTAGVKSRKFKMIFLKSKATYFSIQNGIMAGLFVYITGLINIYYHKQ
ncbi:glycosyltransferase family 2 protein [Lacinutrix algicola]|uniref:glycosyltransferase family 2 protein n=1 Tax=Lacinutrix algicola TaxID=342954 RepID=UPI0006E2078D|nr:glycosyltransferase family 2 protein [Lacinutrix algicola]